MKNQLNKQFQSLWSEVVNELSLFQYETTMGGDMSYKSKAERAMKVSKSKKVHQLCLEIIVMYDTYVNKIETIKTDDFV